MIDFNATLHLDDETYYVGLLTIKDKDILLQLCRRCSEYFYMLEGEEASKEDVCDILGGLPPGKKYEDKFVFGISNEMGNLVGVVDLIRDFPVSGVWIIGLLLLDPSVGAKGLGRGIDDYIAALALGNHANKLRIGVIEDNEKGYGFWKHLGYSEVFRSNWRSRNKDHVVICMTRDISNESEA